MNLTNYYWYFQSAIPSRICDDIARYGKSIQDQMAVTGGFGNKKLTNKQVKDFIVKRYGEYVLLNPKFSGSTIFLWISGPIFFIISVLVIIFRVYFNRLKKDEISKKHSAKDLKKLEAFIKK